MLIIENIGELFLPAAAGADNRHEFTSLNRQFESIARQEYAAVRLREGDSHFLVTTLTMSSYKKSVDNCDHSTLDSIADFWHKCQYERE